SEQVKFIRRKYTHSNGGLLEFFGKDECLETLKGSSILLKGISPKTQRTGSGMVHWHSLANPDSKGYLSYNDGTIDITKSGFYYLSFQVMVNNQESINNTNVFQETRPENPFIKHSIIHRSSAGGRTIVLGNVRHDGCQAGTRTINTGGMFQLKEGDSVHLHSSSVESIVRDTGHHKG
ncbi:hypothetical protein MAR_013019, partial [Mya arenaria]